MKRMDNIMTLRLPVGDLEAVKQISMRTNKDKSTVVRELIELGKVYFAIKEYRENKISIGKASEIAGVSISEMIDILSQLGIQSNLELEDYLAGKKGADKLF